MLTVRTPRRPQALYLDDIAQDEPRRRADKPAEEGPEASREGWIGLGLVIVLELLLAWWAL